MRAHWRDALAWAAVLPVLLSPIANPDVFWHLNAAELILRSGSLPQSETFSFTRLGAAWVDFEWLVQLVYLGFHKAGGFAGLLALKALLLAAFGASVWGLCGIHDASAPARRAALLAWASLSLARDDLKPETFSSILFTLELAALESVRLGRPLASPASAAAACAAFFAFWANLHPGFVCGWALLACYAPLSGPAARAWAAAGAGALAGPLLNPYGPRLFSVLADHLRWSDLLARHLLEWKPPLLANPYHWPLWLLLAAVPLAAAWGARGGLRSRPLWTACLLFGAAALMHARHAAYFIPVGLCAVIEAGRALAPRAASALRVCVAAAAAAHVLWLVGPDLLKARAFDPSFFPVSAGAFIERELPVFRGRRPYNEWGWGGYLSFRFHPEIKVFMDGRYVFHPLLAETAAANADPARWNDLLDRYGVEWALLENRAWPVPVPGGGRVSHFALYMPSRRWALVHRDPRALIYARRGAFPAEWLARRELAP